MTKQTADEQRVIMLRAEALDWRERFSEAAARAGHLEAQVEAVKAFADRIEAQHGMTGKFIATEIRGTIEKAVAQKPTH